MTQRWLQLLASTGIVLAGFCTLAPATERVTLPVRAGDNVSMMLAMGGVSQGVLMKLISSAEIAARLEAVREGNTLELELDDGQLVALWLYGRERQAFRAALRPDGSWQPRATTLSEPAHVAARVRQREALGLPPRAEPEPPAVDARLARLVVRAETAKRRKIEAQRRAREEDAAPILALPSVRRATKASVPSAPRPPAASTADRENLTTAGRAAAKPLTATAPLAKRPAAGSASSITDGDEPAVASVPKPDPGAPTPQAAKAAREAGNNAAAATRALPPADTLAALPEDMGAEDMGAEDQRAEDMDAEDMGADDRLARARPLPSTAPASDAAASQGEASIAPRRCPSIEGSWFARYTNFDCEAQVSFIADGPGVYTMEQDGCGDIDGIVSQNNRSVSGEWEHAICDGVLSVTLDASCDAGIGTWQANAGKALCSEKRYPVVITRESSEPPKRRKRLKLFSGPSKEAAATEDEAAGDR